MEKSKTRTRNKQGRKKSYETNGGKGVGIVGVLIFGGAFAALTFLITFTNKKKKKPKINVQEDDKNHGLLSLLQFSSPCPDSHFCSRTIEFKADRIDLTQIDSAEDENSKSTVSSYGDQEMIIHDNAVVDQIRMIDFDRFSSAKMIMCLIDQQNIRSEAPHQVENVSSQLMGAITLIGEKFGADEINPNIEKMVLQQRENLDEYSYDDESEDDEDENEDDEDESILGKGEGDSEGTGDSSRESNVEPIWPVELIERAPLELKESKEQHFFCNLTEKMNKEGIETVIEEDDDMWKECNEILFQIVDDDNDDRWIITSQPGFGMWPTLYMGVLLMVLHHLFITYYLDSNFALFSIA